MNLDLFRERFASIVAAELDEERMTPNLNISAEVRLPDLDQRLLKFHDRLAPLGEGNEWPLLAARDVEIVDRRQVGAEGRHLKLKVRGDDQVMDAIAFRMGDRSRALPDKVDIAFRLERNEYMGQVAPQMNVVEIRPAIGT
jgi:single-stranded-DNA-specific exonuclease